MANFLTTHLRSALGRIPRAPAKPPIGIQVLQDRCVLVDTTLDRNGERLRARVTSLEGRERDEIAAALREEIERRGLGGRRAHLVLSSTDYTLAQLDRPAVEASELAEALRWQIGEHIDYPAEEAVLQALEMPKPAASRELLQVVVAHRPRLEGLVDLLAAARLRPASISIGELALRNLIGTTNYQDTPLATVLLRPDCGILNITRDGTLFFTRRLPSAAIGGDAGTALWNQMTTQVARDIGNAAQYFERQLGQAPITATLLVTVRHHATVLTGAIADSLDMPVRTLDATDLHSIAFEDPEVDLAQSALAVGIGAEAVCAA